jgi:nucleotidyltransferase/DNA polymerase involved in DNA repair
MDAFFASVGQRDNPTLAVGYPALAFLQAHFGSAAAWCYAVARDQDDRPADPDRTRKSSGPETTFDRDFAGAAEIEAGVLRVADDVWTRCETARAFGRTMTIQQVGRSRTDSPAPDPAGLL